jgi:hypothetical protein
MIVWSIPLLIFKAQTALLEVSKRNFDCTLLERTAYDISVSDHKALAAKGY